jgi:predicted NodU family carbamoyl transferase
VGDYYGYVTQISGFKTGKHEGRITGLAACSCPGVVHVNGTARPQLVSESDNPGYYRVLQEFKRLTGLSCFGNTSFNIHEEPIVCTPQDAIRTFKDGHLDFLAIGPFLARTRGPTPTNASATPKMPGS